MKLSKRLIAAASLVAVAATGSACTSDSGSTEHPAAGSVNLRMTIWSSNEAHLKLFNGLADAYKKTHPEIGTITFDSLDFAAYNTTLTTQIAGGNGPDLAWLGDISRDLIAADALAPLTTQLKDTPGWDYDDVVPALTKAYTGPDGQLYAFPFSNSPFVLYVNDDLLAQADATIDPAALTWDSLSQAGAKVHDATGKAGFVIRDFNFTTWQNLASVWDGWGASPWSEDGKTCTFTSDAMVDAFTFLHKAIYTDQSMPGPGVTADFFAGDAAFTVSQVSRASLLTGSFHYSIYPLPAGPIGSYAVMGQAGMGVLKSSKHVKEAVDFLAFLTNPDNAAQLATYFPPARASLLTGEKLAQNNPKLTAKQLQNVVVDQLPKALPLPGHTHPAEIAANGKAALDAMWKPDADIKGVLTSVCGAISPQLGG